MCTEVMIDGRIAPLTNGYREAAFAANARLAGEG